MTTPTLSARQIRLLRTRAQGLLPAGSSPPASPAAVVQKMLGAQAQELRAAHLSVRARSTGLTAGEVKEARQGARSIVWTWCMRGTLHLISTDDAGWLIPLLGPTMMAAKKRRFRQLGWNGESFTKAIRLLQEALPARGGLTRAEIIRLLERNGLPHEGQAPYYLLYGAALEGVLCYGPDREEEPMFVLVEEWLGSGRPLPRQEGLKRLALRYLEAYGPAGPKDLARWSGLRLGDVREAWELVGEQTVGVEGGGESARLLKAQLSWLDDAAGTDPVVRLLPRFDTYLLGYADRDLTVDAMHARRVHPGGGIIHPVLLVDGKAEGTWRSKRRRARQEIVVEPFADLAAEIVPHLEAEVADLARFTGEEAVLTIK